MKTWIQSWVVFLLLGVGMSVAKAQLVAPPSFSSINLPATAAIGDTITVSATGQGNYSDDSDGNDWNTPGQLSILRVMIYDCPPGGSWNTLNDWMPSWVNPNTASVNVTLNQTGTWYFAFQLMDGRPWYSDQYVYSVTVSPPPSPSITSSLAVSANQGQGISYTITATRSPTSFSASNLPAGLSLNTSTGVISGRLTASSSINSTISATNAYGTDTETLAWSITAASIVPSGSVSPLISTNNGQSVTLVRNGSANFGIAWTDGTIWRPNGSAYAVGINGLGSMTYVPDGGNGLYWYQYRLVDNYYNYVDQWIAFYVGDATVITVTTSGGPVYDGRTTSPPINFGQSVTVTSTVYDPSGTMDSTGINGYKGDGNWVQYATWETFSQTTSHSFSVFYQPASVGSGYHWMAVYGHDAYGYIGRGYNLIVNKATPTGTFAARSLTPTTTGYYTVVSGDLNAAFANPYSGAVAAPTGTVTYRIAGTSTAVTAGTQLPNGVNSIEADYPGDANYAATSVTAAFSVMGPTTPANFHPTTTASTSVSLSWNASTVPSPFTIAGYNIYRGGVQLNTSLITGTTFTDSAAAPQTAYTYTVQAVDSHGDQSVNAVLNVTTAASFEVFTPLP